MTKPYAKNRFFSGKPIRIYFNRDNTIYIDIKLDNIEHIDPKNKTIYFDKMLEHFYKIIQKEKPYEILYRPNLLKYTEATL